MLAIDTGGIGRVRSLSPYKWIDEETISLVGNLLRSQKLSGFLGQPGPEFLGGEWVQKLESTVSEIRGHTYVVSFNSWTSGLDAIFLSLDLGVNAEVIVPTWTMSATISSIINAGYKPVFVDVDLATFNISLSDLARKMSSRTKAVCTVDLFGRPSPIVQLRDFCDLHGLLLVADSAQAPGALVAGIAPSRIADIGGYSLNRHKHLQSGEGGLVVTENLIFAERLRALRNHGEVAASGIKLNSGFIYGHNWRLGEIEALIAYMQYQRFDHHISSRRHTGSSLKHALESIDGLIIPDPEKETSHDYYVLGMRLQDDRDREFISSALRAEGLSNLITSYSGLEHLPAFNPFNFGLLPNAQRLNEQSFIGLYLAGHEYDEALISQISSAFQSVLSDKRSKY